LRIEIWGFRAASGKANRFYLNQLELAMTLSWIPLSGTCFLPICSVKSDFTLTTLRGFTDKK